MPTGENEKVHQAIEAIALGSDPTFNASFAKKVLEDPELFSHFVRIVATHDVRLTRLEKATHDLALAVELATKTLSELLGGASS